MKNGQIYSDRKTMIAKNKDKSCRIYFDEAAKGKVGWDENVSKVSGLHGTATNFYFSFQITLRPDKNHQFPELKISQS